MNMSQFYIDVFSTPLPHYLFCVHRGRKLIVCSMPSMLSRRHWRWWLVEEIGDRHGPWLSRENILGQICDTRCKLCPQIWKMNEHDGTLWKTVDLENSALSSAICTSSGHRSSLSRSSVGFRRSWASSRSLRDVAATWPKGFRRVFQGFSNGSYHFAVVSNSFRWFRSWFGSM
jgi:hypothetical protein